jgi:GNAT superfamily N-acetyltransferase
MILLNKNDYHKAIIPLREVTFNNLFARSVVEQHITGTVYADRNSEPRTFYIIHPYGMALLHGDTNNENFNSALLDYILNKNKIRKRIEWLQVYPEKWNAMFSSLLGINILLKKDLKSPEEIQGNARVIQNTRVNFKFNPARYRKFKESLSSYKYEIVRTDLQMFNDIPGSVVPKYFWGNEDHFLTYGVGFSLKYNNNLACTAYSAFIHDNQLELGIETVEQYRGKGLALQTCAQLIEYCLKNNYEPVWACRLENYASFKLAQKLGFDPILYMPYYKLNI